MAIERKPIDPHQVFCDGCSKDWSDSDESGGILFGSKAYCPDCATDGEESARDWDEERHINGRCPPNQSYADWVREIRGPNPEIVIYSGDDFKKAFEHRKRERQEQMRSVFDILD